jgi:hypothetical protein
LEESLGKREKVVESDHIEARAIDPTAYFESHGYAVIKEGRHLSVCMHGHEAYRCTRKDDGHWVTFDRFENGIGDNIALVQELEPGTGFAEAVYRLSGAPSVAKATRPASEPVVRQPPKMPAQRLQEGVKDMVELNLHQVQEAEPGATDTAELYPAPGTHADF